MCGVKGRRFIVLYKFSNITLKNIYQSFTYKMAAKAIWHRNYHTVTLCINTIRAKRVWRAFSLRYNKAVIDRRLRPRCCHLGSYFKHPKSSPVRPLACNWYYCAQSVSKPKAACTLLRFSWAAASSNWLVSKCDVNHKVRRPSLSEKDRATATGFNMHKNFGEYRTRSSEYDDRGQTNVHMHTHAHHNTPLPCRGRSNNGRRIRSAFYAVEKSRSNRGDCVSD